MRNNLSDLLNHLATTIRLIVTTVEQKQPHGFLNLLTLKLKITLFFSESAKKTFNQVWLPLSS